MEDAGITSWLVNITLHPNISRKFFLGEPHGTGPSHPVVQQVVREMILGPGVWYIFTEI